MQEGDRGESDSREGGGTRGQEMREVDATGGKTNGRKEARVDVTKHLYRVPGERIKSF